MCVQIPNYFTAGYKRLDMHFKLSTISKFTLLMLLCIKIYASQSQNTHPVTLNLGDPAPSLKVNKWLKGMPLQTFEKGRVYVVEFWASWCKPCIAAMPHLSTIARQYGDKITILGIDVFEKNTPEEKVKKFVDSMGDRIDYFVATDKDKFMETYWVKASGDEGIPNSIIVNADGKVAWIGHPKDLEEIVPKILENKWDIQQALIDRNLNRRFEEAADSMNYELMKFRGNYELVSAGVKLIEQEDRGKPDSALFYINEILKQEPRMEYQPLIVFNTFYSLLKIDTDKALTYGKKALTTSTSTNSTSLMIIGAIEICSCRLTLPSEIYELCAEAIQVQIALYPYPELANIPKYYHKTAWWYWLAKNKSKAIEAEQAAVNTLKSRGNFLPSELAVYKAHLDLYKTCKVED